MVLGDDRPAALGGGMSRVTLGYALLVLNAVPMEARVPVLAVGSNASDRPDGAQVQLRRHLVRDAAHVGQRHRHPGGVAAMISRWGYVPAAPVFEPGVTSRLAINWLDPEQLEALDETEHGYDRRLVVDDGGAVQVELDSGEQLRSCGIYVLAGASWPSRPPGRPSTCPAARSS